MYIGKLVKLRPFEPPDAERYRGWINDPEVAALVDRARPVTPAEHRAWYERIVTSDTSCVLAVERVDEAVALLRDL